MSSCILSTLHTFFTGDRHTIEQAYSKKSQELYRDLCFHQLHRVFTTSSPHVCRNYCFDRAVPHARHKVQDAAHRQCQCPRLNLIFFGSPISTSCQPSTCLPFFPS